MKYIKSLKNVIFSKLLHLGIVQTGCFTLKNGSQSNIYMDLRQCINYPVLFSYLTQLLFLEYPNLLELFKDSNAKLIPIPLGGFPLGFHLAFEYKKPLLMIRDKEKEYGTKKLIEGIITPTDQYILIEDVITSGSSIIQTIDKISNHILINTNNTLRAIICICNRGNIETLKNIPIYNIFTLEEIQNYITDFSNLSIPSLASTSLKPTSLAPTSLEQTKQISYFQYDNFFNNLLYHIALNKKSNIILSCDFMTNQEILDILQIIGSNIIAVKLHLDTLETTNYSQFCSSLNELKNMYNFLIIEDAKYADINSIMIQKINNSQLCITHVADAFTMHSIAGLSILEEEKLNIPGIVVAEMSSSDNLITTSYTKNIIDLIHKHYHSQQTHTNTNTNTNTNELEYKNMLGGIVCQSLVPTLIKPFEMATFTPGINIEIKQDMHNQQYKNPSATNEKMGLFWIVGRGITIYKNDNEKLKEVMETYQTRGWNYFIQY